MRIRYGHAMLLGGLLLALTFDPVLVSSQERIDDPYAQAGILVDDGRYRQAIPIYQELLKDGEGLSEVRKSRIFNNLGYCHFQLNDYDEAYACYRQALDLDDGYSLCLNNISAVLIKQSRFKEALGYLHRAYDLDPNSIKALFNLFTAYAKLENQDLAKYYLKLAFEKDTEYTVKRLKMKNVSDRDISRIQSFLDKTEKKPDNSPPSDLGLDSFIGFKGPLIDVPKFSPVRLGEPNSRQWSHSAA